MSGRRAKLVIKAENPEDPAILLQQIPHLFGNHNLEIQIKRPTAEEPAPRTTTSRDEQLETLVAGAARAVLSDTNRHAEADRAARGVAQDQLEIEPVAEIAEKRESFFGKLRSMIGNGWKCTVRCISQGVSDSMLNK